MHTCKKLRWLVSGLLLLGLMGCGSGARVAGVQEGEAPKLEAVALAEGERLRVVATTSIVGDVVAQVGGDAIDLTVLMAPGQDPHAYQASAQDLAKASAAHLIFVNGFDLEEGLLQELEQAAEGVPILSVSSSITPIEDEEGHEGEAQEGGESHAHAEDPHVWFDVRHVVQWTESIRATLSALDPTHSEQYAANAQRYTAALDELHTFIEETLAPIPAARRTLITNHDTFRYFARAYKFEVIGTVLPNASQSGEVSAADLAALIETVREAGVPAIFVESTLSEGTAALIAGETGARLYSLYTDALGPTGSGADSYIGMMRQNAETLRDALTGEE